MNTYLCNSLQNIPRIGFLIAFFALSAGICGAQEVSLSPVPRLVKSPAGVIAFARPRRVSAPEATTALPYSFDQATAIERLVFELINQERMANGLLPLAWDSELCRLARHHSEDMGGRGYFDHETPEGLFPKDRARAAGLRGFRVIAENIAYNKGYQNPAAHAVQQWMRSSGHRANILFSSFQYSAIGSYVASDGSVYVTQVFISR